MTTYDQARQFGKGYVGALNTSRPAFAALFAPDARVAVDGAEASLDRVPERTPPGRSAFRRARLDGPGFVLTVRVLRRDGVDDQAHRIELDEGGRIRALEVEEAG
jgi:hypothetical protein